MFKTTAVLLLLAAAPLAAQIQSRPTDPPIVTAVNESWYQLREPIQFAGDVYYPAGPTVFFNGNIMVRTGHYNGVPLYADTTLEPYSVVLVPVSRGGDAALRAAATRRPRGHNCQPRAVVSRPHGHRAIASSGANRAYGSTAVHRRDQCSI